MILSIILIVVSALALIGGVILIIAEHPGFGFLSGLFGFFMLPASILSLCKVSFFGDGINEYALPFANFGGCILCGLMLIAALCAVGAFCAILSSLAN